MESWRGIYEQLGLGSLFPLKKDTSSKDALGCFSSRFLGGPNNEPQKMFGCLGLQESYRAPRGKESSWDRHFPGASCENSVVYIY